MRAAVLLPVILAGCPQDVVVDDRDALVRTEGPPRDGGGRDAGATTAGWRSYDVGLADRLFAVHGTAADDVWAVGERGVVLHFDGSAWTRVDVGILDALRDVFAVSRDEVWVVGENGAIARRTALGWTVVRGVVPQGIGGGLPTLAAVAAASATDVWVVPEGPIDVGAVTSEHAALRFDGNAWTVIERPDPGSYEKAIVLAGATGFILHDEGLQARAGNAWLDVDPPVRASLLSFNDAALDAMGRLWIVAYEISPGRSRVFRGDGTRWSELEGEGLTGGLTPADLTSIQVVGDEAWAAGELGQLSRFDGQRWVVAIPPSFSAPRILDLFVTEGRVFAVGARGGVFCSGCP